MKNDALMPPTRKEIESAMNEEILELRDALAKAQQVAAPDGWVLVPIEPTPEMCAAGFCVSEAEHDPAGVYRAMLAAAQGANP